ncbi:MAG: enterotoxin [Verrucomicrobia bacterium]|nr:enterotoxin [Verrucomicrobiota bacterium]
MQTVTPGSPVGTWRIVALTLTLSSVGGSAQPIYPTGDPGPATMLHAGTRIVASNSVLAVSWSTGNPGLRTHSARDLRQSRELRLTGEIFDIVLADGRRYPASALESDGPVRLDNLTPDPLAAQLAARIPGQQITVPLRSPDGRLRVVWLARLHDGDNYVRQQIEVTAALGDCTLRHIAWLNHDLPNAQTIGRVDGSPVVAGSFFLGCEDPHALNQREPLDELRGAGAEPKTGPRARADSSVAAAPAGRGPVVCRIPWDGVLKGGDSLTQSLVLGVAPDGQLRRAFLCYLERERAHPYRPYLHYNSWYDIAWDPFALNETNCLEAIRLFGERFIRPHGITMDGMVFDDGWDDPRTLWHFHSGFPNGFAPLAERCRQYHTRLGVWLSPFGGYGEPKAQRMQLAREQGYETNATGFSMAGPKYYAAFKNACVRMIRDYGVNHFKFDGMAAGMYASGGAEYLRDTIAMRRLMLELRQEDPSLYLNLTTGSWPSPFWLRYADSLWRQGNDMGRAGKGPNQQQWLTYRDQEVYRNVVLKGPCFPLNSLMTQGVAYSRRGMAGDPTFNSAGFRDDVRAFFGSGTGLQELYLQPDKLTPEDWRILAEAARWSRANADILVDTHWIGGDPAKLEVYGYASWSPRKGILMLRNPDDQPRNHALDIASAFELPHSAPTTYLLASPWAEDSARPARLAQGGTPVQFALAPFEIVVLDAVPRP